MPKGRALVPDGFQSDASTELEALRRVPLDDSLASRRNLLQPAQVWHALHVVAHFELRLQVL